MTTIETAFGTGIPLVNFDKGSPVPLSFVFELSHKLAPSHIRDGLSKVVVLDHVLNLQTLNAYHLVFAYDASRELVLIITPSIGYPSVYPGNFLTGFLSILRAFFLLSMPTLRFCQLLLILGKEPGIPKGVTIRGYYHAFETQVKPDLLIDDWQLVNIFFYQNGDEVSVSAIFG